jgi:hypothetical protein
MQHHLPGTAGFQYQFKVLVPGGVADVQGDVGKIVGDVKSGSDSLIPDVQAKLPDIQAATADLASQFPAAAAGLLDCGREAGQGDYGDAAFGNRRSSNSEVYWYYHPISPAWLLVSLFVLSQQLCRCWRSHVASGMPSALCHLPPVVHSSNV